MNEKSDSLIFCRMRRRWVVASPEEKVRQALIQELTGQLGYPLENVVLEKSLAQLPHLRSHAHLPQRRTDLIIFGKGLHADHSLYPLLLIECKACPLTSKTLRQLIGYNYFVRAPFIAVVNAAQRLVYSSYPPYQAVPLLPYESLLKQAQAEFQNQLASKVFFD